jgi:outer membrane immunogenic protein
MQKTLAAATVAALVGVAGAANAADVYTPSLKDPISLAPATWAGFYFGVYDGYSWGDQQTDAPQLTKKVGATTYHDKTDGDFGGVEAGYSIQRGNIVLGTELDLGALGINGTVNHPNFAFITNSVDSGLYFDLTTRLGYSFGPALVYAKGGLAFFDGDQTLNIAGRTVTNSGLLGWTIGGGVEYKVFANSTVKLEYQYFDFGDTDLTLGAFRFKEGLTANTVKIGFNYYLSSGYEPLK